MEDFTLSEFLEKVWSEKQAQYPDARFYDLGCGDEPIGGATGLDFYVSGEGVEQCDLFSFPWKINGEPIPDNSVDLIYSSHFIEHVPDWYGFFAELYRVARNEAVVVLMTPYYMSVRATQDPDHKQMISRHRYAYFDKNWRKESKTDTYTVAKFGRDVDMRELMEPWYIYNEAWAVGKSEDAKVYGRDHIPNAVDDICAFLFVKKD